MNVLEMSDAEIMEQIHAHCYRKRISIDHYCLILHTRRVSAITFGHDSTSYERQRRAIAWWKETFVYPNDTPIDVSIRTGLEQAARGEVVSLGDFTQYVCETCAGDPMWHETCPECNGDHE